MADKRIIKRYRQQPVECYAFQFKESHGVGDGVLLKPKKHVMNPSDWYILDQFRKEQIVQENDWIIQRQDGSCTVVNDGSFLAMWEEVKGAKSRESEGPGEQDAPPADEGDGSPKVGEKTSSGRVKKAAPGKGKVKP